MSNSSDPEKFWDTHHRLDTGWLAATPTDEVLRCHRLGLPRGQVIVDIGVGRGFLARDLCQFNTVICVDIAPHAISHVPRSCPFILMKDLNAVDSAHLAICHLVFQHCSDEQIDFIFKNLKLGDGTFSFQFASLVFSKVFGAELRGEVERGEHHFRPLERIFELMTENGWYAENAFGPDQHLWKGRDLINWHIVHAKREPNA